MRRRRAISATAALKPSGDPEVQRLSFGQSVVTAGSVWWSHARESGCRANDREASSLVANLRGGLGRVLHSTMAEQSGDRMDHRGDVEPDDYCHEASCLGCDRCYAERITQRFLKNFPNAFQPDPPTGCARAYR